MTCRRILAIDEFQDLRIATNRRGSGCRVKTAHVRWAYVESALVWRGLQSCPVRCGRESVIAIGRNSSRLPPAWSRSRRYAPPRPS